jgi:hypothetical protein
MAAYADFTFRIGPFLFQDITMIEEQSAIVAAFVLCYQAPRI